MLKPYIIYFRCTSPGAKKPGPVKQFRLYATNSEEARQLATQYATYPSIEVLHILLA